MGRELQKKKNKSSINKVKQKPKSKKVHVQGSSVVASNWSQAETLSQNYRRLGLTPRLSASTGGVERTSKAPSSTGDALRIKSGTARSLLPTTARVERAADGSIVRVIHEANRKANPLNDPLAELSSDDETNELVVATGRSATVAKTPVVAALEAQARRPVPKRPRQASQRESEWVKRLVDKYGDDFGRMARDRKLNPMQQSEGDIRRRVNRWKAHAQA